MSHKSPAVEALIDVTSGLFLEIGGPSQHFEHPPFIDFAKIKKPMIVTNIATMPAYEGYYEHPLGAAGRRQWLLQRPGRTRRLLGVEPRATPDGWGEPEFFVPQLWIDGTDLLHGLGELGALYTVSFPPELEPQFFRQAARTLEPDGILVVEWTKNMEALPQNHFSIIRSSRVTEDHYHFAAQRNDRPFIQ